MPVGSHPSILLLLLNYSILLRYNAYPTHTLLLKAGLLCSNHSLLIFISLSGPGDRSSEELPANHLVLSPPSAGKPSQLYLGLLSPRS